MPGSELQKKLCRRRRVLANAAVITAGLLTAKVAKAADSSFMITWSVSGSTAMRNFTISEGFTTREAGVASLQLSNGSYDPGTNGIQFAPSTYTGLPIVGSFSASGAAGVRMEWHEQGSVEGILELVNDQVGYDGGFGGTPIIDPTSRNPSGLNPIRLNRNNFTSATTINGYSIASTAYNTYDPLNYGTFGGHLLGGQNRVQMAISDVKPIEGFSKTSGTTPTGPIFGLLPGQTGFGKGNSQLTSGVLNGLGVSGGRQQLVDDDSLNMSTLRFDPGTIHNGGGSTTYGTGTWNTAGVDNLVTKTAAMTATVFAANPGTGLTQINRGDAQWLQTAGRLANGADFNVTERDVNSGTRNVFSLNTGVDGSWAVGENDDGNGNPGSLVGSATIQYSLGSSMRFSGKTAGGGQLRPTLQNNRMALGPLGMSDAIGAVASNFVANPLRALAYSDTADDTGASFVTPTATTITDGSYVVWQQEQYVTVRTPDANYAFDNSVKGDTGVTGSGSTTTGDIAQLRNNVLDSVNAHFPNNSTLNTPADQLLFNSFILPQMMLKAKDIDGGPTTDVSSVVVNGKTHAQWRADMLADAPTTAKFNAVAAINVTKGASTNYGKASGAIYPATAADIPITANDSSGVATSAAAAPKGNYLFGNFNQTGVRDLSAVLQAQVAQAAMYAAGGTLSGTGTAAAAVDAIYVGSGSISNNTKIATGTPTDAMNSGGGTNNLASKGDLIVLGDYNGDGKFNGRDLYLMARGASLTDAATSTANCNGGTLGATSSTFGDKLRSGVLHKNAVMDYFQNGTIDVAVYGMSSVNWATPFSGATAQQKKDATANATNDVNGLLAFEKSDVNRDGLLNRSDVQVVDHFVTKDYRNITDQLQAVISTNGTLMDGLALDGTGIVETPTMISLVDVELNDTGNIDEADLRIVRNKVGIALTDGDANFDGKVDIKDLRTLATHFNQSVDQWSEGDFDLNGIIDATDLGMMARHWQEGVAPLGAALASLEGHSASVPEPTCISLMGLGMVGMIRRRRRR